MMIISYRDFGSPIGGKLLVSHCFGLSGEREMLGSLGISGEW